MLRRRRVKRTRAGTYRIELPTEERDLLRHLLPQLRELITDSWRLKAPKRVLEAFDEK